MLSNADCSREQSKTPLGRLRSAFFTGGPPLLREKGIVRKTFLFSALLITVVTLISFAILYFAMPGYYRYQKEATFQRNLDTLVDDLRNTALQEEYEERVIAFSEANNAIVLSFGEDDTILHTISTPILAMQRSDALFDGNVSFSIRLERPDIRRPPVREQHETRIAMRTSYIGDPSHNLSMRGEIGTPIANYIWVSTTLQPIDESKHVILSLIPYVLLISIVLGLMLARVYARQISKPILQISAAAEKMQRMQQGVSAGIHSDDELGLLSQNLDSLYASLVKNIEDLRCEMGKANALERSKTEMLQSASHELKTPIAALSGMLEGMIDNVGVYKDKDKYLVECIGETRKLSVLVEEILSASKSDMLEDALDLMETSLDGLARRVLEEYDVPICENKLRVTTDLSPVTITTDWAVLYRALSNMVSNAVRYTEPGGEIRIKVQESGLTIENQCRPIPENELSKLFEPFYTRNYNRDKAKSGTGLGLYIVKRNLSRLGISYSAENGEIGLKIVLKL